MDRDLRFEIWDLRFEIWDLRSHVASSPCPPPLSPILSLLGEASGSMFNNFVKCFFIIWSLSLYFLFDGASLFDGWEFGIWNLNK